jgi:DNA-binding GntR family transcriptional regulator
MSGKRSPSAEAPLDVESKQIQAYKQIKELIIDGTFEPLRALREVELAQMLDTSRTPVREALRRLAAENFVEYVTNKGVVVCDIGLDDVADLMDARLTVEASAIRICIQRMDSDTLRSFRDCLAVQERVLKREDLAEFAACDRRFHRLIVSGAKNVRLENFWKTLIDHTQLVMNRVFSFRKSIMVESLNMHTNLFEAIANKNTDVACALIERHINDLRGDIIGIIMKRENDLS